MYLFFLNCPLCKTLFASANNEFCFSLKFETLLFEQGWQKNPHFFRLCQFLRVFLCFCNGFFLDFSNWVVKPRKTRWYGYVFRIPTLCWSIKARNFVECIANIYIVQCIYYKCILRDICFYWLSRYGSVIKIIYVVYA